MSLFQFLRPIIRPLRSNFTALHALALISKDYRRRAINNETTIVIEGSPRSGNSFLQNYFSLCNPDALGKIAHHTHTPAQVIQATAKNLPILITMRDPYSSAISMLLRSNSISPKDVLLDYIQFHEAVYNRIDSVVLTKFSTATAKPQDAIVLLNSKFGTSFNSPKLTSVMQNTIFQILDMENLIYGAGKIEAVARPSLEKEEKKLEIKDRLSQDVNITNLLTDARNLYSALEKHAI